MTTLSLTPPRGGTPLLDIGASPLDVDRLVKDVNAALIALHTRRLNELGPDASGLYAHYEMLLGRGSIIREYEAKVFKLLRTALPSYDEYAVLRAGLGELAFLIGEAGLRVTACESDQRRFEAMVAGLRYLTASSPALTDRIRAVRAYAPDQASDRSSLAVATDFVLGLSLESDENFRRQLRGFDALFICPRLFLRTRNSLSEQRSVIEFLRHLGFTRLIDFPEDQMVYAARPPGTAKPGSRETTAEHDSGASAKSPEELGFDALVERLMSVVPDASPAATGSTWIERRVRKFNLRSAFGSKK